MKIALTETDVSKHLKEVKEESNPGRSSSQEESREYWSLRLVRRAVWLTESAWDTRPERKTEEDKTRH